MDIIKLEYYNPLCSMCIACTICNISIVDFKKMHFIYNSVQNGYIVGLENPDKYYFVKNNDKNKNILSNKKTNNYKKGLQRSLSVP